MFNKKYLVLFVFVLLLCCGCSVTHITSRVAPNALKIISEKAVTKDYMVEWVNEDTIQVSKKWPVSSVANLGPTVFHADLHYNSNTLIGDYYLQTNSFLSFFLPTYIDLSPDSGGLLIKPFIRREINEILGFVKSSIQSSLYIIYSTPKSVIK
jgi:hypothetical protein